MKRKYVEGGREESAAIDEEEEKINTFFTLSYTILNKQDNKNGVLWSIKFAPLSLKVDLLMDSDGSDVGMSLSQN
nr:hypothetical protein CFP56_55168 [Quercus suber]